MTKHQLVLPAMSGAGLLVILLFLSNLEEQIRLGLQNQPWVVSTAQWISGQFETSNRRVWSIFLPARPFGVGFGPYDLPASLCLAVVAFTLAYVANSVINLNTFSLHGMYRMRLMRAFLGASNPNRRPNGFTGFDPNDSPREKDLPHCPGVPLHMINTTLNLVGTENTAWQQRKAESFTFSPICCGAWREGYVPTELYGGTTGVSLATAMTISGAAFNPNMGYHSSPVVMFLMTLFNARLGWWLPNLRRVAGKNPSSGKLTESQKEFLRGNKPAFGVGPLLREAFGSTNDTYKWIELTDGAHFENLGLYEMVMRRCHQIVVIDAGADPNYQFEDLGNAIRKIRIDFGIRIEFQAPPRMCKPWTFENRYCAVGTIDYAAADGKGAQAGSLIYIKTVLRGDEPPDILQYAATHATFPNETTANQFFNESQFESYRHLGEFVIETIGRFNPQLTLDVSMSGFEKSATEFISNRASPPTEHL